MFDLSDNMYILGANNYATLMCCPIMLFSKPNKISFGIESLFPKSKCSENMLTIYVTIYLFQ